MSVVEFEARDRIAYVRLNRPKAWAKRGLGGLTRGQRRLAKPVIAAVNGWAVAGGFELALTAEPIGSRRADARRG